MSKPREHASTAVVDLTKEHVWADWLRQHIPRTEQGYGVAAEEISPDTIETIVRNVSGDPHARRIRKVCRTCNNGWMNIYTELG